MLVTSALHHPEADDAYLQEATTLLAGTTPCEMAQTMIWLARHASNAMVRLNGIDGAAGDLQRIGCELLEAHSAVVGGAAAGDWG